MLYCIILHSQNPVVYGRIFAVVKHPSSYYILTTFHVLNLPRFAAFCLFCDKFNNLWAKIIVGKLRQIEAEYGILGGFSFMIKVLFVCHGRILKSFQKACKINGFTAQKGTYYTIFERALMWQKNVVRETG